MPLGGLPILLLQPGWSPVPAGLGSLVMGFGMGMLSTSAIVMVQSSVGWAERGRGDGVERVLPQPRQHVRRGADGRRAEHQPGAPTGGAAVGFDQIRHLLEQPGALRDAAVQAALGRGAASGVLVDVPDLARRPCGRPAGAARGGGAGTSRRIGDPMRYQVQVSSDGDAPNRPDSCTPRSPAPRPPPA